MKAQGFPKDDQYGSWLMDLFLYEIFWFPLLPFYTPHSTISNGMVGFFWVRHQGVYKFVKGDHKTAPYLFCHYEYQFHHFLRFRWRFVVR